MSDRSPAAITRRYDHLYVGGNWRPARGPELLLRNPTTEEQWAALRLATPDQARDAVLAAAAALAEWSTRPMEQRAAILAAAGDSLLRDADAIAAELSSEIGTPIAQSRRLHIETAAHVFKQAPRWTQTPLAEADLGRTLLCPIPFGVAACITPWNYPLYLAACKVVPALLAGATVVLKPSELAPASIVRLTEALIGAGIPDGVFNMLFGGPDTGEQLVSDPQVDVISFTGSTAVGRRIAESAGRLLKKVSLELGGKSASVVLEDAALAPAVAGTLQKGFQNAGQTCAALSRLLVPEARFAEACSLAADGADALTIGDPLDPKTQIGPLISARQRDGAIELIETALRQGARRVAGDPRRVASLRRGYFVAPTVLTVTDAGLQIFQTEAFAPVLTITPYRTEDEAVALANATPFGLSGAVWSSDEEHALAVARRLRAGSVSINGARTHPDAPFGGFGASGFGRERGPLALDEFRTIQALNR
ncbi:MAG: aldehyde dehydrogenase family protein [Steroidobacteraceae bacterium]